MFYSQVGHNLSLVDSSCQLALLVKDEHRVLVKGYGLSQPRKRVVRIN